jgi:hypothetical protein
MQRFALLFVSCLLASCSSPGSDGGDDSDGSGNSESGTSGGEEMGEEESGSETSGGEEETGGDGDTCGNFIGCHEPQGGDCHPGLQDCPEGEKCTAYVQTPGYCCVDANKCVEVIGDKQLGDPCDRMPENDDCDVGLFCMTKTSGDTGEGVCLAFCDVDNPASCTDAGLPDANCIGFNDGVLPICQDPCDPLTQDCTQPQGCYGAGNGFICTLPGYDEGKGNDGDDCYTVQSCKAGLLCVAGEGQEGCQSDYCCTPFCECDPDMPNGAPAPECSGQEQCICYFSEMAPPQYETVGLCYTPE